jgi:hypothetical protein
MPLKLGLNCLWLALDVPEYKNVKFFDPAPMTACRDRQRVYAGVRLGFCIDEGESERHIVLEDWLQFYTAQT